MNLKISSIASVVVGCSVLAPVCMAQHVDIGLTIVNQRLTTGTFENGAVVSGARVFGSDFGELFPNFTDEPGFDNLAGTFPFPSSISFNILGAVRMWDGSSFVSAATPSQISIGFGPLPAIQTPLTDETVAGFAISVNSNGEWHRHLEYTLDAAASDGIYLLALSLEGSDSSMQESLPFWIVFNQNLTEIEHDAAIDWAIANLATPNECSWQADGCFADYNNDGGIDGDDVIGFFANWDANSDCADVDVSGGIDGDDVIAFFAAWDISGC